VTLNTSHTWYCGSLSCIHTLVRSIRIRHTKFEMNLKPTSLIPQVLQEPKSNLEMCHMTMTMPLSGINNRLRLSLIVWSTCAPTLKSLFSPVTKI